MECERKEKLRCYDAKGEKKDVGLFLDISDNCFTKTSTPLAKKESSIKTQTRFAFALKKSFVRLFEFLLTLIISPS